MPRFPAVAGRSIPAAVLAALSLALVLALPAGAQRAGAQTDPIADYFPQAGNIVVVVPAGGPLADLIDAAAARGCDPITMWQIADHDRPAVVYIPGAPAFVNSAWIAALGGEVAAEGAPILFMCRAAAPAPPSAGESLFEGAQVVSVYGYPGFPVMGILGAHTPQGAADEAARLAGQYDALNGSRDVIPALQPIVSVAQRSPGADGTYLSRMPEETLRGYLDVARARGLLVIIDVQGGWADPLTEVQRFEWALREPFVHLALDPEYMTRSDGVAPGVAIGTITEEQVNAVQAYLADLVRAHDLPPKVLVVHQFTYDMVYVPSGEFADEPLVDIVIDMDGFGTPFAKLSKYDVFSLGSYAERAGIKLFFEWDAPLLSPAEIQALTPPPDLVIYQ